MPNKEENEIEEMVLHIRNKYSITEKDSINLCLLILSEIFNEEPQKIYKLAETKTKRNEKIIRS